MKKYEALAAIEEGKKVTHTYFDPTEFIKRSDKTTDEGDQLYEDEHGYLISSVLFWHYRQDKIFEDGWEIYSEPTP